MFVQSPTRTESMLTPQSSYLLQQLFAVSTVLYTAQLHYYNKFDRVTTTERGGIARSFSSKTFDICNYSSLNFSLKFERYKVYGIWSILHM